MGGIEMVRGVSKWNWGLTTNVLKLHGPMISKYFKIKVVG